MSQTGSVVHYGAAKAAGDTGSIYKQLPGDRDPADTVHLLTVFVAVSYGATASRPLPIMDQVVIRSRAILKQSTNRYLLQYLVSHLSLPTGGL